MKSRLLLLFVVAAVHLSAADTKPNFIVIFADDLGYGDLGCYGATDIRTPHLDKMAAEGMRFTSFYAQPICGPSRAALMTGCYPMRLAEPGNVKNHMTLPHPRETLLSEILKGAGYGTAQIGKWDLAGHHPGHIEHPELAPLRQGFDSQFGTPASNDVWKKTTLMRDGKVIEDPIDLGIGSTTRRYTDEAIRVIRERKSEPFFIYLCPNMPHTALNVGEKFRGKSQRGLYGDVIEELDHEVGRVLDTLHTEGIAGNTLVFFTSDNGPWIRQKEHGGSPGPLRGGKASTWEAGVRVPAIAWAPGRITPGQTCDHIASTLDLLPTLTTITGAAMPQVVLDGRDLSSWLLKGPPTGEDDGTYRYYLNTHLQAVRMGKWKLVLPRPQYPPWLTAGLRSPTNPHVLPPDTIEVKEPLLHDLQADLGETTDVSKNHPEVVGSLLTFAEQTRSQIGDYDRIGSEARFFDAGPKRPDMNAWKKSSQKANGKQVIQTRPSRAADEQTGASVSRPNFIVIFTDDQGWADLGCQGVRDDLKTPHLDALAASGVRCTAGYITAPQCSPSRAGLLTGRYQQRFGLEEIADTPMPTSELTIAERLKPAGYVSGMVGKWHLDASPSSVAWIKRNPKSVVRTPGQPLRIREPARLAFSPAGQGFDEFYMNSRERRWANFRADGTSLKPEGEWITETNGDRLDDETAGALAFLERNHAKPFFLYLAYSGPHTPLAATPERLARFPGEMPKRRRTALAMLATIDDGVGRIRETLRKHGLEENTLIVFTSDNGAPLKKTMPDSPMTTEPDGKQFEVGGWDGSMNAPQLGEKGMLTEGGIREPFLWSWKGVIPAGQVFEHPVSSLDIAATILKVAGGSLRGSAAAQEDAAKAATTLDGTNLLPHFKGEITTPPHAALYWRFWKQSAIRAGDWKLIHLGDGTDFLFDLSLPDPETKNLASSHPEKVAELRAKLEAWTQQLRPPGLPKNGIQRERQWYEHYFQHPVSP